jgi:type II secretory pathway predicted ATPase ExeA
LARYFNTEGPVRQDRHYQIPPLSRIDLRHVERLIEAEKYFLLHAPRQTGKTSSLRELVDLLNWRGRHRALYVDAEAAKACKQDVACANLAVAQRIAVAVRIHLGDDRYERRLAGMERGGATLVYRLLMELSEADPKPMVVVLDEIDSLVGDSLLSILHQLRDGYAERPRRFPQSVILCGLRDVKDYQIETTGSPFNIRAESMRLGDFTRQQVEELYSQHTAETGQVFEPDAVDLVWDLTRGQPWLVNALAHEVTWYMPEAADPSVPITRELIERAKESIILKRATHIDQLMFRLREDRVRRVILPLLLGNDVRIGLQDDDASYCRDLGLIREGPDGVEIANPIYREVVPRCLTTGVQADLQGLHKPSWYIRPDQTLDIAALMRAFQQFFRENSESWSEQHDYKEAGPQLLLQAFLQRIVNGGGRIEREYGLGRRRTDLLVIWPHLGGTQRVVFELKSTQGPATPAALNQALDQTADYMDKCGTSEGHLVWFDRGQRPWDDKIGHALHQHRGRDIHLWTA